MAFINRMNGQDYIENTRLYLDYLEEHLENVRKAFNELSVICKDMAWVSDDFTWHTLRVQVENHDLSKFSAEEFTQYRARFYPVNKNDCKDDGFIKAIDHHIKSNHHHHETAKNFIDIVHMVIDWTAMGYKFGDTARQYYEKNKDRIRLSEDHKRFMYTIFDRIDGREHEMDPDQLDIDDKDNEGLGPVPDCFGQGDYACGSETCDWCPYEEDCI